jgi:rRNA-processing protein FCF1
MAASELVSVMTLSNKFNMMHMIMIVKTNILKSLRGNSMDLQKGIMIIMDQKIKIIIPNPMAIER